jgi:hypothetical protein
MHVPRYYPQADSEADGPGESCLRRRVEKAIRQHIEPEACERMETGERAVRAVLPIWRQARG